MNKLVKLQIVGDVSVCSSTVRVKNQAIGAQVYVNAGNTYVGGGTATWTDQAFPLIPDAIKPNDSLSALQMLAGWDPSDASPVVTVTAKPNVATLSQGQFFKPFHICSGSVALLGLFPGASVEVSSKSKGDTLGHAVVNENGVVQVDLNRTLQAVDDLVAVQTACGNIKGNPIAGGVPVTLPNSLPTPTLDDLFVCGQYLHMKSVTPGAQVTLERNGSVFMTFRSAVPDFPIYPIAPLKSMETVAARCSFPDCGHGRPPTSSESMTPVQDKVPDPPKILSPLCEGQTYVGLAGLQPGATVELTIGADKWLFGAPAPAVNCTVPPLAVASVSARQNLCVPANWSNQSPKTTVNANTPQVPTLVSPAPSGVGAIVLTPTLAWKDPGALCNQADKFDVELSEDGKTSPKGSFTTPLQPKSLSVPHVTAAKLKPGTKYFWHVRAHKGSKVTPWSIDLKTKLPWTFTTAYQTEKPMDPSGPYDNDPPDTVKDWWFIEDCCAGLFYRKLVFAHGTFWEALAKVKANAEQAGCAIVPEVAYKAGFDCGTCDNPKW